MAEVIFDESHPTPALEGRVEVQEQERSGVRRSTHDVGYRRLVPPGDEGTRRLDVVLLASRRRRVVRRIIHRRTDDRNLHAEHVREGPRRPIRIGCVVGTSVVLAGGEEGVADTRKRAQEQAQDYRNYRGHFR